MKRLLIIVAVALLTMSMMVQPKAEPKADAEEEFFGYCRKETKFESIGYYWTEDGDTATAIVRNKLDGSTTIYTVSIGVVDCGGIQ